MPSWVPTFASACLSGRCSSPGTASYLADSQRLTGYLVYPEGLPVSLDPSSMPSYSFHGAPMDITTQAEGTRPGVERLVRCGPQCVLPRPRHKVLATPRAVE